MKVGDIVRVEMGGNKKYIAKIVDSGKDRSWAIEVISSKESFGHSLGVRLIGPKKEQGWFAREEFMSLIPQEETDDKKFRTGMVVETVEDIPFSPMKKGARGIVARAKKEYGYNYLGVFFDIGHIDPLAVRQRATRHNPGTDFILRALDDFHSELAIIQRYGVPFFHHAKQFGMRQIDTVFVSFGCIAVEHEFRAGFQLHLATGELADTQFRSLKVRQNRNRSSDQTFHFTNRFMTRTMIVLRAMAEIETEHIDTRLEQSQNHFLRRTGRSQCRYDLCFTLTSHNFFFAFLKQSVWRENR